MRTTSIRVEITLTDSALRLLEKSAKADATKDRERWEQGLGLHQNRITSALDVLGQAFGGRARRFTTAPGGVLSGAGWLRVHVHGAAREANAIEPPVSSVGSTQQIVDLAERTGIRLPFSELTCPCPLCGRAGGEHYCGMCTVDASLSSTTGDEVDIPLNWTPSTKPLGETPEYAFVSSETIPVDPAEGLRLAGFRDESWTSPAKVERNLQVIEARIRALLRAIAADADVTQATIADAAEDAARTALLDIVNGTLGGELWTAANLRPRLQDLVNDANALASGSERPPREHRPAAMLESGGE